MSRSDPTSAFKDRYRNWRLSMFALRHPVWVVVLSAGIMFVWVLGGPRAGVGWAVIAAGAVAAVTALLWSPQGWARRRTQRLLMEGNDCGAPPVGGPPPAPVE